MLGCNHSAEAYLSFEQFRLALHPNKEISYDDRR